MLLRELLNTCQNQWEDGRNVNLNLDFKIQIQFEEEEKIITYDAFYYQDNNYLLKYRDRKVLYWYIANVDKIIIEIEGKL